MRISDWSSDVCSSDLGRMKFTLSWLKTHLNTDADLPTVLKGLTNIGLEVEGVENPAEKQGAFRIARVLTAERHPQADKLQVLTVDAGDRKSTRLNSSH